MYNSGSSFYAGSQHMMWVGYECEAGVLRGALVSVVRSAPGGDYELFQTRHFLYKSFILIFWLVAYKYNNHWVWGNCNKVVLLKLAKK